MFSSQKMARGSIMHIPHPINPFVYQKNTLETLETVEAGGYIVKEEQYYSISRYTNKKVKQTQMPNGLQVSCGILTIPKGFFFDGASGPAIDTPSVLLGALIHDALYAMLRKGLKPCSAGQADTIYRKVIRAQGTGFLRAWTHYFALRAFGWTARKKKGVINNVKN